MEYAYPNVERPEIALETNSALTNFASPLAEQTSAAPIFSFVKTVYVFKSYVVVPTLIATKLQTAVKIHTAKRNA